MAEEVHIKKVRTKHEGDVESFRIARAKQQEAKYVRHLSLLDARLTRCV